MTLVVDIHNSKHLEFACKTHLDDQFYSDTAGTTSTALHSTFVPFGKLGLCYVVVLALQHAIASAIQTLHQRSCLLPQLRVLQPL
jgi:hypothetical protein